MRKAAVGLLARSHYLRYPKQKFLFVLGHMRSGSSLLTHFLQSCPEVCGYGETNANYSTPLDLHKLAVRAKYRKAANADKPRYFIDQINHNDKTPDWKIFDAKQLESIVIVREPQAAISSILKLNREHYGGTWSDADASSYYTSRLNFLMDAFENCNAHVVRYEQLIADAETVLKGIESNFDVAFPSYSEYVVRDYTGTQGDPGQKIKSGKIVPSKTDLLDIAASQLQIAQRCYDSFIEQLCLK